MEAEGCGLEHWTEVPRMRAELGMAEELAGAAWESRKGLSLYLMEWVEEQWEMEAEGSAERELWESVSWADCETWARQIERESDPVEMALEAWYEAGDVLGHMAREERGW